VRGIVFGDQEDSAGVAVQPVHDPRPEFPAQARELAKTVQQGVDQRPAAAACARVHDHSGGLVHCRHVVILVQDFQGDRLRLGAQWRRRSGFHLNLLASPEQVRALLHTALNADAPGADPLLNPGAAIIRQLFVQEAV